MQEKLLWCFLVVISPDNKIFQKLPKIGQQFDLTKFCIPRSLRSNCVNIELLNEFLRVDLPYPRDLAHTEPTFLNLTHSCTKIGKHKPPKFDTAKQAMNAHYLPTCTKPGGMGNDVHSLLPPKKNIAPNYNPPRGETPHGLPYSCIYRL